MELQEQLVPVQLVPLQLVLLLVVLVVLPIIPCSSISTGSWISNVSAS